MTTEDKIKSFSKLEKNWNFGRGDAILPQAIEDALALNNYAVGCGLKTDAFPCDDGGVLVTAYKDGKCLEVIVDGDVFKFECVIDSVNNNDESEVNLERIEDVFKLIETF
jgi:hypothetical protein